jgi:hypothetical protein
MWLVCPKELKRGVQTNICAQVFIAALFTTATGGNNPMSIDDEWIDCGLSIQ